MDAHLQPVINAFRKGIEIVEERGYEKITHHPFAGERDGKELVVTGVCSAGCIALGFGIDPVVFVRGEEQFMETGELEGLLFEVCPAIDSVVSVDGVSALLFSFIWYRNDGRMRRERLPQFPSFRELLSEIEQLSVIQAGEME